LRLLSNGIAGVRCLDFDRRFGRVRGDGRAAAGGSSPTAAHPRNMRELSHDSHQDQRQGHAHAMRMAWAEKLPSVCVCISEGRKAAVSTRCHARACAVRAGATGPSFFKSPETDRARQAARHTRHIPRTHQHHQWHHSRRIRNRGEPGVRINQSAPHARAPCSSTVHPSARRAICMRHASRATHASRPPSAPSPRRLIHAHRPVAHEHRRRPQRVPWPGARRQQAPAPGPVLQV